MGGLVSKNDLMAVSTPQRQSIAAPSGFYTLTDDPRSPSVGIERTPIVIDKINECTLDPRSPTAGIVRTPIVQNEPNPNLADVLVASSMSDSFPLLPNLEGSDGEKGSESMEELDRSETTSSADLQSLSLSDVDESSCLLQDERKSVQKLKNRRQATSKAPLASQRKQLFQCGQLSPIKAAASWRRSSESFRGPSLRDVDTNSPRSLVQRKAMQKVDAAGHKFCMDSQRSVQNKENIEV